MISSALSDWCSNGGIADRMEYDFGSNTPFISGDFPDVLIGQELLLFEDLYTKLMILDLPGVPNDACSEGVVLAAITTASVMGEIVASRISTVTEMGY